MKEKIVNLFAVALDAVRGHPDLVVAVIAIAAVVTAFYIVF